MAIHDPDISLKVPNALAFDTRTCKVGEGQD
jgi:hypothetical protein